MGTGNSLASIGSKY